MKELKTALNDLTDRDAFLRAVTEHDSLRRQAFLDKYPFGPARRYLLVKGGRYYDSVKVMQEVKGKATSSTRPWLVAFQFVS
ncbi:hypothetical protein AB4Y72_16505 [Arthrobacter sp. YAF34]|uniref:hypothetical protein n=1 Tax=Arthrobacter sp. YAF34 TaxID=3233083 RepID=UPI003F936D2B